MIKVLLVEDQAMVRGALSALLQMEDDIQVLAECANGNEAWQSFQNGEFDIVLTDIEMPELNGLELIGKIRDAKPTQKIAIITTFGRIGYIQRALELKVDGFFLKDGPSEALAQNIRQVLQGQRVVDPQLALAALTDECPLSKKELAALNLASHGLSTEQIATKLCLSNGTIRNYLSEAINKLNVRNRIEAARLAKQKGWI